MIAAFHVFVVITCSGLSKVYFCSDTATLSYAAQEA
jgi:hypothetical protein